MKIRIMLIATIAAIAQMAGAANSLPVSNAWNIAPSGNATSSGELHFRMTAGDANPVDITVPIMSGAKEGSIARYIQRALSSQLRAHQIDVEAGEGTNVILTGAGEQRLFGRARRLRCGKRARGGTERRAGSPAYRAEAVNPRESTDAGDTASSGGRGAA